LLSIVLLFAQAMCDLTLPDLMSQIVNYGIQQDGITEAAPAAIRQSEMDRALVFLGAADAQRVLDDYVLVDRNSSAYGAFVGFYPALAKQPVYLRKSLSETENAWLESIFGKALLVTGGLEEMLADPAKAAAAAKASGIDLSRIPAGTDVFALLGKLPAAQRDGITAAIDKQFSALGSGMTAQAAARMVRAEYRALGVDTTRIRSLYIWRIGGIMLVVSLLGAICAVAVALLSARIGAGFARDLRRSEFEKVEGFSNAEFDRFSTATLITRTTNDITQLQMVVIMMIRMVFYAPIIAVGAIIRAMNKDVSMWWIIALAVVVIVGLILLVFTIVMPKFRRVQTLIDRLNLVMRENLSGMMVIRAFDRQEFERQRFDSANTDLTSTMLFVSRVFAVMMPVMMLVMNALSVAIIWVGSHQVAEGNMQVGDMMAFLQYAMQIVFSFLMLSFMFIILPRASVSAARIADVLETEATICDPEQPQKLPELAPGKAGAAIAFKDVRFRYPGAEEDALEGITFTALPGQMTAFIGPTGAGKSTLVNLIPRFYDVSGGSILLDGVDIRAVRQHDLRDRIGYVPQKATLFSGTIESNLRYANEDASGDILAEAAAIAQAAEFVSSRPEGLAADISQGGTNVSGGQKQRLSIARALVKQAPVYIFDDSFSALDFKTDAALRRALHEQTADSTLLVVTQRVSTIKNADQIIVLDDGRIVGKGTHRELLESCETYREIASSQLSKEELA
jgi:ATP-binding cassette subfamily B protein